MTASPTITPSMIKELRVRTGVGMMDCKKALGETGGDLDAAIEELRKKGIASAEKKAGRIAAEGVIAVAGDEHAGALVEVNCETDFVAKDASFRAFADSLAGVILANSPKTSKRLPRLPSKAAPWNRRAANSSPASARTSASDASPWSKPKAAR